MNILRVADGIVNRRSQEKNRKYGEFVESMRRTAAIATLVGGREITPKDAYMVLVGLKLSRESFNHREDNLLDAVAYLGSYNNMINQLGQKKRRKKR